MAKGINKVILVGNLGKDPEVRYMPNGDAICNLTVATSDSWKDKQTGENKEITEWHRVSFFGRLAEVAGQYLKKGSKVYIEGSLRTRKYTDNNGVERYVTEIRGAEMQMLDSRAAGGASGGYDEGGYESRPSRPAPARSSNAGYGEDDYESRPSRPAPAPRPAAKPQASNDMPNFDDGMMDDDIPF